MTAPQRIQQLMDRVPRDPATSVAPLSEVSPVDLCIIQGCHRLRVGTNLCRWHEEHT